MRQPTLREALGERATRSPRRGRLHIFDFFCGAGGVSEGAKEAGCVLYWACDSNEKALETYKKNHPDVHVEQWELPVALADIPFPTDRRVHCHFSPPCQELSAMAYTRGSGAEQQAKREGAVSMVEWCVQTALRSPVESFSIEEAPNQKVLALFERLRRAHPKKFGYAVIDFWELGVPQHRKRVIAGTPELVAGLLRRRGERRGAAVVDWIPRPRGTHTRDSHTFDVRTCGKTVASFGRFAKPITGPSSVVLCDGTSPRPSPQPPATRLLH